MGQLILPPTRNFVSPADLRLYNGGHLDANQLTRLGHEGKLVRLRNGLYRRADFTIRGDFDRFLLAGALYPPSYVSTYSALRHYNLIPESVYRVTSITTRKTRQFLVDHTTYTYQKLQSRHFFGYRSISWRGETLFMADPEKALIDLAYLEPEFAQPGWLEEMRLDHLEFSEVINRERLLSQTTLLGSQAVSRRIAELLKFMDDEES